MIERFYHVRSDRDLSHACLPETDNYAVVLAESVLDASARDDSQPVSAEELVCHIPLIEWCAARFDEWSVRIADHDAVRTLRKRTGAHLALLKRVYSTPAIYLAEVAPYELDQIRQGAPSGLIAGRDARITDLMPELLAIVASMLSLREALALSSACKLLHMLTGPDARRRAFEAKLDLRVRPYRRDSLALDWMAQTFRGLHTETDEAPYDVEASASHERGMLSLHEDALLHTGRCTHSEAIHSDPCHGRRSAGYRFLDPKPDEVSSQHDAEAERRWRMVEAQRAALDRIADLVAEAGSARGGPLAEEVKEVLSAVMMN